MRCFAGDAMMRDDDSRDVPADGDWNSQPAQWEPEPRQADDASIRFGVELPPPSVPALPEEAPSWWNTRSPTVVLPQRIPRAAPRVRRGVSRRAVLVGAGAGALGLGALGAGAGVLLSRENASSAIPNVFDAQAGQVAHLLRRAGFGPSPADYADYLNAGVHGSIDRLLNYSSIPDDLDSRLAALNLDFSKQADVVRWWLLRMIYSKHPLEEKMTLFWHGVLTSALSKVGGKKGYPFLIQQNNTLRKLAFGRFDDLIHAVSIDPAMLIWLDGHTSTGRSPNENYARELMELFTMGIGNYTQDDVHQGALALTGWTIRNGQGVFVPGRHYNGAVTYLGQTGPMGLADVVRLVCAHPSTPKHIAWRMWSFFVYENPSDADVQPLVDAYHTSSHNIGAMVKAMLASSQFFSAKAYRARVKSPVEFVIGAIRGLGVTTDAAPLPVVLDNMGQLPFDPPNVSGWDGDKVSGAWVSTQAWMTRVNFINALVAAASGIPLRSGKQASTLQVAASHIASSPIQQVITQRKMAKPQEIADYYIAALLDNNVAVERKAVVYNALTSGPTSGPSFTLAGGAKVPAAAVRNALYLAMSMPDYHLN